MLYSEDLKALLNSSKIKKPLEIWEDGISFLLQSGIVPTPYTLYKNLYVLSMGDEVSIVATHNNEINLRFSHNYYYFHKFRKKVVANGDYFLELLKRAILERVFLDKEIYLFHSAGKDSNLIALALAESELKEKVICITLKGPKSKDESPIAKELARKMGLKHVIFELPNKITSAHYDFLKTYFQNMFLPAVEGGVLIYPFYTMEFDFQGKNLLDGSGVDVFAGHVPRKVEYQRQKFFSWLSFFRALSDSLPTGNLFQKITLTRAEWIGLDGFTYSDTKKLFPQAKPVYPFWKEEEKKRKNWDYFDFKADLWATHVEYGNVMRKVRILAEFSDANLIFPFTDEAVAKYLATLPVEELFCRKTFTNKLFFRKILKEKLNFEADTPRKFSYPFDSKALLMNLMPFAKEEIFSCPLWEKKGLNQVFQRLSAEFSQGNLSQAKRAVRLLLRLFILSAWYNHRIVENSSLVANRKNNDK
ncbi:MAG: asparagine synthase-related protein [Caldimicrobium sp.]